MGPAGSGGLGPVAVAGSQARNSSPGTPLQHPTREKVRPARQKTPILGHYEHAGRTFSRSHPPPDPAGRTFSRTGHSHVSTVKPPSPQRPLMQTNVKPPSPMLAPEQQPLKPTTPMQAKNAPKTPNSHPQRRWRFQLRLGRHPQRRWRFQLRLVLCPQRQCRFQLRLGRRPQTRSRFQTSEPPGRQGLAAAPVGGGGAWPGDQWTADVTNVVKPTQFKSPNEDPCYKRRQSEAKNHYFSQKCRRIDDICNKRRINRTISSSD